jgi:hypothetical protein
MRINPRKIWKIVGRIWIAPKRIFETFGTQEAPRCIGNGFFSYTIFPVKKINVGKNFKTKRKRVI